MNFINSNKLSSVFGSNPYDWFKRENPNHTEITGIFSPGTYSYGSPSGAIVTSYIPETQKDKNNNDIPVLTNFVSSGYNASNPSGLMAIAYHGTTQGYFNYPSKLITHCKFLAVYHNNIRDLTMVFSLAKIQNVDANKVIYSDATAPAQNVGIYKDGQKHYLFWRDGSNFGSINVTRYYDDANNKSESKDVWLYLDGLNLYYMIDEFDYTKFSLLHTFSTSFYISPQYLANSIATGSLGCRIDYVISKLIFSR